MVMGLLESPPMSAPRTGGQILVANLLRQGVDLAFCVPDCDRARADDRRRGLEHA